MYVVHRYLEKPPNYVKQLILDILFKEGVLIKI